MFCSGGHKNPARAKYCGICGVNLQPQAKRDIKAKIPPSINFLLVSVGEAGGSILAEYYRMEGLQPRPDQSFLLIDTSQQTSNRLSKIFPENALKVIGSSPGGTGRNLTVAENIVSQDPTVADSLFKAGLNRCRSLFLVANLGGGTGSGAGPHIMNFTSELDLEVNRMVMTILPSDEESDLLHFNAYCGLSRFLSFKGRKNVDLLFFTSRSNAERYKGVDKLGREMSPEKTLASILAFVTRHEGEPFRWLTAADLTQLPKSTGIVHCIPCFAFNHSLRIYGSLSHILESAVSRPLADVKEGTTKYSFLFMMLPSALRRKVRVEDMLKEYHLWKEQVFPNEIGGDYSVTFTPDHSDRISLMLLLGGCDLSNSLARTVDGYLRIKSEIVAGGLEAGFLRPSDEELMEIENTLTNYEKQMRLKKILPERDELAS